MRRRFTTAAFCMAAVGWFSGMAAADSKAPNRQTFTVSCGGATVTFVSPVEPARAAQIVGTTGVGILQQVSIGGAVLFEQPSLQALDSSRLTTCTFPTPDGDLTFIVLTTPQAGQNP